MRSSNSMFILMKLKTRKNMVKIKIQEIKDRGNDEERIVLRVLEDCNLCRYLVLDTTFDKDGNISNKNRPFICEVAKIKERSCRKGN